MAQSPSTEPSPAQVPSAISGAKLHAVRFAAIYYTLLLFAWPLTAFPGLMNLLADPMRDLWYAIVSPVGALCGVAFPISTVETGSGDRLFDHLQNISALFIALIGVVLWWLLARKAKHPERVYAYLRVFLRYVLGAAMLSYGFAKLGQFPAPRYSQLSQSFGTQTPMALLWNFMGASRGYTAFSGVMEVSTGLLVLFRRTTLLGACLGAGVTLNIFALNVFYDVPVKVFSFQLFVACLILIAPDVRRLIDVFVLNRPTPAGAAIASNLSRRARWAVTGLKAVYVLLLLYGTVSIGISTLGMSAAESDSLAGVWNVASYKSKGVDVPASHTRPVRLSIDRISASYRAGIALADGSFLSGAATFDVPNLHLPAPLDEFAWRCSQPTPDQLTLTAGSRVIELVRDVPTQRLMSHHIHWIQEKPRTP